MTTRAWHLMSRPNGLPTMNDFALKEVQLPDLQDGWVREVGVDDRVRRTRRCASCGAGGRGKAKSNSREGREKRQDAYNHAREVIACARRNNDLFERIQGFIARPARLARTPCSSPPSLTRSMPSKTVKPAS